mgnify:CR=1 FL=1
MDIKLESGKKVQLKNLTVDERDELLDSVEYDNSKESMQMKMMHSTMTKFIRIGVKGDVTDSFIKKLTLKDKTNIFTAIHGDCLNVGEEKASN